MGVPYLRGGRDPEEGLDCVGLKIEFWQRLGFEIADPYENHCTVEGEFVEVETRRFADSICVDIRGDGLEEHVAVYLGMGLCIHVHRSRGVEVIPLDSLEGKVVAVMRKKEFAQDH